MKFGVDNISCSQGGFGEECRAVSDFPSRFAAFGIALFFGHASERVRAACITVTPHLFF